jgi:hypothetical protein
MKKNSLRTVRVIAALLIFTVLINAGAVRVMAEPALTVSQTVDHNTASFTVSGAVNAHEAVTVLVMQKLTHSVAYMDQAVLNNGEYTFSTLLPKGDYSGYVGSAASGKVALQDFSIETEEAVTGVKSLQAVTVIKGESPRLPSSVIAVFDSGANREAGVQWTDVPGTDTLGQYTATGTVNGTTQTVQLILEVVEAVPTPTPTPTPTPDPGNGSSGGGQAATPKPTPAVKGSVVTAPATLDSKTGTAAAEVPASVISTAFGHAAADSKGVKAIDIILDKVDGAKSYEPILPASALTRNDNKQVIKVSTPAGIIELPGNMLKTSQAAAGSTVSVLITAADKSVIADTKVREAVGNRPVIQLNLKVDGKAAAWENKGTSVKVSVPYKPNAEEQRNPEHIVIWYIDGAGKAVKVPNAKYNAETGMVTFRTNHFSTFAVAYEFKTFADADIYPWARNAIEVLASKGIIEGISEASFSPAESITRADFLVLLVRTLGITADFNDNFSDVSKSDYYYEALGIAKKLGISNGAGDNVFHPREPVSRQDLMVLSARALKLTEVIAAQGNAADIAEFKDRSEVTPYAVESIASMVKEGLVAGSGDALHPMNNATRAETAVIMYRIFNKL